MARNSKISVPWSDLPPELLQKISDSLDTETDVLRFRAVCNSWRSSTTPFNKPSVTSLKLPYPFRGDESVARRAGLYFRLAESVVYRLQSPDSKVPCSWLVKLERSTDGKLRIYNPLNDSRVVVQPNTPMPKVVNALDYRVSEVCRAYTLNCLSTAEPKWGCERNFAKKVAVSAGGGSDDYVVMAIDDDNKLWYIKSGDEKWTQVDEYGITNRFHDVMFFKGQFYVVGENGEASVFDSTFKLNQLTWFKYDCASIMRLVKLYGDEHTWFKYDFASLMRLVELYGDEHTWFKYGCTSIMRLVELYGDGELYLVEGVTYGDRRLHKCNDINNGCVCRRPFTPVFDKVEEIIIYRMDKQKQRWVEMKTVNDRIIFAGNDCSLSFSTKEFDGGNGTRVFYPDRYIFLPTKEENGGGSDDDDDIRLKLRELHGHNTGVCDFESGKIGSLLQFPEFAGVFWPPPAWLR